MHTPAEMAQYWSHPELVPLRAEANRINAQRMSAKARGEALKAPLNAIRDKVTELKNRNA